MTKKRPRLSIKVKGIIEVLDANYELVYVEINKQIILIRYYNPQSIKAHLRTDINMDLVSLYWVKIITKILKFKGYK